MAGGHSTRMGRDKAALPWAGGDLLDHAIARLAALTSDVRILSGPQARYLDRHRPVVTDAVTNAGGLAALITALRELRPGAHSVLLAVDLPLVPLELLRYLVSLAVDVDAVVPTSPRGAEPFCAVYASTCREAVERALADGRLKMTAFWSEARVRQVTPAELARFGEPAHVFCNVNTADDYARARLQP